MNAPRPDPRTAAGGAPELSFVVPVYDEAANLPRLFAALLPLGESLGRSFEIVCVDDGSRDESAELLRRHATRDPRVRWESLPGNRGKGAAVRRGMQLARGELRVFLDADLATDLAATQRLLAALEDGADVVLGSRNAPGARIARRQSRPRELLGRGFRALARAAFAPDVHDFTCGFKGFRAAAARAIFERARIDRWAFDVELVVIARAQGLRVEEVAVVWEHREGSKVRLAAAVTGSLRDLARILVRRAAGGYR